MDIDFENAQTCYLVKTFPYWINENSDRHYEMERGPAQTETGRKTLGAPEDEIELNREEGHTVGARVNVEGEGLHSVPVTLEAMNSPFHYRPDRYFAICVGTPVDTERNPGEMQSELFEVMTSDVDNLLTPDKQEKFELNGDRVAQYSWQDR